MNTYSDVLDGACYTAILFWQEEVVVAVGHLLEHLTDHGHRLIWVVEGVAVAMMEIGIASHECLTFPALVVAAESVVVQRSVEMPILVVEFVLDKQ